MPSATTTRDARTSSGCRAPASTPSAIAVLDDEPTGTALIVVGDGAENSIVVVPGANGRVADAALATVEETAMEFAARTLKITLPADHAVDAAIDLGPEGGAFSLAARLYVSLPGMERATVQRLVEAAHEVCPYSRATHRHRHRNYAGLRPLR